MYYIDIYVYDKYTYTYLSDIFFVDPNFHLVIVRPGIAIMRAIKYYPISFYVYVCL